MPNIKSAKKRVITSQKSNAINTAKKSEVKTAIKKFHNAVDQKNVALAQQLLSEAYSVIDCAMKDGIYKKNTAARKKATLGKLFDKLKSEQK